MASVEDEVELVPNTYSISSLLEQHKESMQDSVDINKSLFTLRKVILTLSEARPGMPQRAPIPDQQTPGRPANDTLV